MCFTLLFALYSAFRCALDSTNRDQCSFVLALCIQRPSSVFCRVDAKYAAQPFLQGGNHPAGGKTKARRRLPLPTSPLLSPFAPPSSLSVLSTTRLVGALFTHPLSPYFFRPSPFSAIVSIQSKNRSLARSTGKRHPLFLCVHRSSATFHSTEMLLCKNGANYCS